MVGGDDQSARLAQAVERREVERGQAGEAHEAEQSPEPAHDHVLADANCDPAGQGPIEQSGGHVPRQEHQREGGKDGVEREGLGRELGPGHEWVALARFA